MHSWPTWARWLALLATFGLAGVSIWLVTAGGHLLRVLGVLTMALMVPLAIYSCRAVHKEPGRQVDRRYTREFMPAMLIYAAVMVYVWPLQKTMEPGWLKAAVATLPTLPTAWIIIASIRFVLGSDELEQRQHMQAVAIGVAIVSIISMLLGFLTAAGVLVIDASLALLLVYPALCLTYGAAHTWLVWRSRSE